MTVSTPVVTDDKEANRAMGGAAGLKTGSAAGPENGGS